MEKVLLGVEALTFLEKEGFPVLKAGLANDPDKAASVASALGFPVALKISSPDVIHKTEEGGVRVFLTREEEVRQTFQDLVKGFRLHSPGKRLDGVMVQHMGTGLELIVGSLMDPQFGPVLLFGLGGIFAEAMKDVSFRLIPIEPRDAREMIEDLRSSQVLTNPRGARIDLTAIEQFLLQVSRLIVEHGEIQEMDLNPVFASSRGTEICDARIKIDQA
ncbi:MAG TPA: acetate--CoA ligase family protein [Syntrophorhabdales bacterium]|nr:acetate--CoA ligase family protein [Syntrophorhabdales bacterium]